MAPSFSVLSVGSMEACTGLQDALSPSHEFRIWVAREYLDVLQIQNAGPFAVAILETSIPADHLRKIAQHIRHEWPRAMILLLGDSDIGLDDPLYDERIPTDTAPGGLSSLIRELTTQHCKRIARCR